MRDFSFNPDFLLNTLLLDFGKKDLAKKLNVPVDRIRMWTNGKELVSQEQTLAMRDILSARAPLKKESPAFRFADLFAGIGGIRMAFERQNGECVFTSEWNPYARQTYRANFVDPHPIAGDITQIDVDELPEFDVLVGGFPCQPFSIAGVSKKNSMGRPHGFKDKTQGTLFFDVARIIAAKRPKAFLLENVKNLASHDKGRTLKIILETLSDELGYSVHYKVLDAKRFVPQHRERIIIVGFAKTTDFSFDEMVFPKEEPKLSSILHAEDGTETPDGRFIVEGGEVHSKHILSPKLWAYLQSHAEKHKAKGNGFGFGLVRPDMVSRTLSARYYKDGSEILVERGEGQPPRRLTVRECARLQGFSDDFIIPVSDAQGYKQFGNSVAVPLISEVARLIARKLD